MTRGRLVGGLVAFAVALGGWLVLRTDGSAPGPELRLAGLIDTSTVALRIREPDGARISVERRDGDWSVNGYPAEDSVVQQLVARLDTLAPARVVARNPANHDRLGVTDESGRLVQVRLADGESVEFILGKEGPEGYFVRLPGSDDVFVLPAVVGATLARRESAWRDLTIATLDTASVSRIRIGRRDEPPFDVVRDSTGWRVDGVPADSTTMNLYLQLLAQLEASGFPADSFVFAADFDRPAGTVDVFTAGSAAVPDVSLLFATSLDHPHVLVRLATDPIVYTLQPELANLLTPSARRLTSRPPD